MPTLAGALKQADSLLKNSGNRDAERDARYLLAKAAGKDLSWLLAHSELEIEEKDWNRFKEWVTQRAGGKPIAYITGHQEFYGRDFVVSPAVLIPRPETELLIEQGLKILALGMRSELQLSEGDGQRSMLNGQRPAAGGRQPAANERPVSVAPLPIRLADIGTGSGCIAVTLAAEIPRARIVATDISDAALQVAKENAARHGVTGRIQFYQTDLLPQGAACFDAIFSNPPYVAAEDPSLSAEVRTHEPQEALFAGQQGMEAYDRIVPLATRYLKPGGWLILELGYQSERNVRPLFARSCWQGVEIFPDLQRISRCLVARLKET